MAEATLTGVGVLVTRPEPQAAELVAAIEHRGGRAYRFPSLVIAPRPPAHVERDAARLGDAAITIFISRNAVLYGLGYASGRVAAIGPSTAAEIEAAGSRVDIRPAAGFDSEHLLAEDALADVDGKRVRIVRGSAGREELKRTLEARGARVEYLSVYERRRPGYTAAELEALERHWRAGDINAVVVMSVQSLENLLELLPGACRRNVAGVPLVTPAARVLKVAGEHHPDWTVILSPGPQADDIADSIAASPRIAPAGRR